MEQSLYVNSHGNFFEEIEDLRVTRKRLSSREERRETRIKAISLIDELSIEFGDIASIPDDHPKMLKARMMLGAYDDEVTKTNVRALRRRVAGLAKEHRIPQSDVYRMLAYYLDLSAQTVKDKAYNNRFTRFESEFIWEQLRMLEKIKNLGVVIHLYNQKEEEYRKERARRNRKQMGNT